jgi:hypothetical protein
MSMKRQQTLQSFVYRGLAKRIALATMAIVTVLTAVIVVRERPIPDIDA